MNNLAILPFLFIGLIAGCWQYTPYPLKSRWLVNWLGILILILFAKLGQVLLPFHHFSWEDLLWEIIVAIEGIATTAVIFPLLRRGFTIFKKLS